MDIVKYLAKNCFDMKILYAAGYVTFPRHVCKPHYTFVLHLPYPLILTASDLILSCSGFSIFLSSVLFDL
jgi:hypothetical protein